VTTIARPSGAAAEARDRQDCLIGFRRHLEVVDVPGDATYLFSERDAIALRGRRAQALVPLLDGTRDLDSLLGEAPGDATPAEVRHYLAELERAGLLAFRGPETEPRSATTLLTETGVTDPAVADPGVTDPGGPLAGRWAGRRRRPGRAPPTGSWPGWTPPPRTAGPPAGWRSWCSAAPAPPRCWTRAPPPGWTPRPPRPRAPG
jgi:hypothetical protein